MKFLYMLVGPSGCGKTTFRKAALSHLPCVSPDDFIVGKWTGKKAGLAWEHAHKISDELFNEGTPFVFDAMFVNPETRKEWQNKARSNGYEPIGVILDATWEQIQENQRKRGDRGLYGAIPVSVQKQKYEEYVTQKALNNIEEGFFKVFKIKRDDPTYDFILHLSGNQDINRA